jgi:hypothetical protein
MTVHIIAYNTSCHPERHKATFLGVAEDFATCGDIAMALAKAWAEPQGYKVWRAAEHLPHVDVYSGPSQMASVVVGTCAPDCTAHSSEQAQAAWDARRKEADEFLRRLQRR